jgi:hypothetical protein
MPNGGHVSSTDYPPPIPDSYWVIPGRLLAGEYPGALHENEARQKLRRMLAAGVTFFLDLTEENELKPYSQLLAEGATSLGCAPEYRRMPVPDLTVPTKDALAGILDAIDRQLGRAETVYVHCWGGVGRTGTVVGCYLVRHGLSGKQALAEIARLRKGTPDGYKTSPETEAQRQTVRSWKAGE